MLFKRNDKLWEAVINCDCRIEGNNERFFVKEEDIQKMEQGYKGKIVFYANCPICNRKIIIPDSELSFRLKWRLLLK